MADRTIEVGFVSADRALVGFLTAVLEMHETEATVFAGGTIHRLEGDGVHLKVLVPTTAPVAPPRTDAFFGVAGIRYVTLHRPDLDAVLERAAQHGGTVTVTPTVLASGVRVGIFTDPDGNTIEIKQSA